MYIDNNRNFEINFLMAIVTKIRFQWEIAKYLGVHLVGCKHQFEKFGILFIFNLML